MERSSRHQLAMQNPLAISRHPSCVDLDLDCQAKRRHAVLLQAVRPVPLEEAVHVVKDAVESASDVVEAVIGPLCLLGRLQLNNSPTLKPRVRVL